MAEERVFVQGLYFDKPSEAAPDFVKGKFCVNPEKFIESVKDYKNEKGLVYFDLLKAKNKDTLYFAVNTYNYKKPQPEKENTEGVVEYPTEDSIDPDSIPFN